MLLMECGFVHPRRIYKQQPILQKVYRASTSTDSYKESCQNFRIGFRRSRDRADCGPKIFVLSGDHRFICLLHPDACIVRFIRPKSRGRTRFLEDTAQDQKMTAEGPQTSVA